MANCRCLDYNPGHSTWRSCIGFFGRLDLSGISSIYGSFQRCLWYKAQIVWFLVNSEDAWKHTFGGYPNLKKLLFAQSACVAPINLARKRNQPPRQQRRKVRWKRSGEGSCKMCLKIMDPQKVTSKWLSIVDENLWIWGWLWHITEISSNLVGLLADSVEGMGFLVHVPSGEGMVVW